MFEKLFSSIAPVNKTKVVELSSKIFLLAERIAANERWQLSYFLTGSYGNSLLGQPQNWRNFNDFFTSRGGVYLIFPTESADDTDTSQDLGLFDRFGASWVVPDEAAWDHIPTKPACFVRGINIKGVKKTGSTYLWRIHFDDTMFTNATEDHKSQVFLPRYHRGLVKDVVTNLMI